MKRVICRTRFRRDGLTLIEVLVILVCIVLLVAILLPAYTGPGQRRNSHVQCLSNLKQTALSYHLWRTDNADVFPWEVTVAEGGTRDHAEQGLSLPQFQVLSNYVKYPRIFDCPRDKERKPADNNTDLTTDNLSYFINAASNTNWPAAIMAGDRHVAVDGRQTGSGLVQITMADQWSWAPGIHGKDAHTAGGNVAFLDGHVEFSRANLQQLFQQSGVSTNRLVIP